MLLLVGLGNPGPGYAGNRHNAGFMAVDEIVRRHGFSPYRKRFQGDLAEGRIGGEKVFALKPMTYMNDSGVSVQGAMAFYKFAPDEIIVLHDEIDLVPGKIRVKRGGGHGGHNGLRDITRHIGADFWRVRIGVGHPGHKDAVEGYVLRDFAKDERPLMEKIVDAVAGGIPLLVEDNAGEFMNRVAREINPPRPKPARPPGDENGPAEAGNADSSAGGPRERIGIASSKDSNGL